MGSCTEDYGHGSGDWNSISDWKFDWNLVTGEFLKPGNGEPGTGKPGNSHPENGRPETGLPGRPDNSTTRPAFPEKPADCKCRNLPLKQRQIKTGIQYEYAQNDGELILPA